MAKDSRDYYSILGVEPSVSKMELKQRYYELAKKYHVDANSDDPELRKWSYEMTTALNEAYFVLEDPYKRKEYDQRRSDDYPEENYADDEDSESEQGSVYIQTLEQGKEILNNEFNDFSIRGLSQKDERKCRKRIESLINKEPQNFLRFGIPSEYPIMYLSTEIEDAVEEFKLRIKEKKLSTKISSWFVNITFWLIILVLYLRSYGMNNGFDILGIEISELAMFLGIFGVILLSSSLISPIARFIAKGFKSTLLGIRGIFINISVGILLFIPLNIILIPFLINSAKWGEYTSEDNKFSVLLPLKPIGEYTTFPNLVDNIIIHQVSLSTSKTGFPATFIIHWFTYPEPISEYDSLLEDAEESILEGEGVALSSKEKIADNVYLFTYKLPEDAVLTRLIRFHDKAAYFLSVGTKGKDIEDPSIKKFFDSFEAK